jgi:membrane protease YdiL (CAAX protease family)
MGLRDIGLKRPKHWGRIILLGVGLGLVWPFLSSVVNSLLDALINPVVQVGNQNLSLFSNLNNHNISGLFSWIVVSFTFAAFGEEIIYRGYMVSRFADLFGSSPLGLIVSVLVASLAFGFSHAYQGLSGVISSFITGLLFGFVYVGTRRNLWANVIFHGINDAIGFVLIFLIFNSALK